MNSLKIKNYIQAIVLALLFVVPSLAQLDRSKRPLPGPAPKIELGQYSSFKLDNGLTVFVVENNKLPVVNIRLVLDRDPIAEGPNVGYLSIAGDLLRTGTKTKTKDQIDEEVDFIGASLSTTSTGMSGSSLKKFSNKLLGIMSDIILNYNFTQEELDKAKKQHLSNIASDKDDPNSIANTVQNALVFGKDHPYGEPMTEQTVSSVTLDMCKKYVDTYFKPNIAYMALVGDITKDEAETLVKKYFGAWKAGDVPKHKYNNPKPPAHVEIALVDRPASVQSVITLAYPIYLKLGDKDYIPANLMNTIFGGTSTSHLFMDLREKKGYTYGAYSSLNTDILVGSFDASLQARNDVTDSSVTELLNEMRDYRNNGVKADELQSTKNYITGSFARALENPQTIARFAINTAIFKLPKDYYPNYLKNVASVSTGEINDAIQKYIKPDSSYVVVVGNAEQVKAGLSKIAPVSMYDIYGTKEDTTSAPLPEGLNGNKVIENYINALGGKENMDKVQDRTTIMTGKIQNFDITMTVYQKAPDLMKQVVNAMGADQIISYDGTKGMILVGGNKNEITGRDLNKYKLEATMDLLSNLHKYNITANLIGMDNVDGKKAYKVELLFPDSTKWTQYFDPETGLKIKDVKPVSTPQGDFLQETTYSDYRDVQGVKYPYAISQTLGPQKFDFTVTSIKVNTGLTDDDFKVE